MTTYHPRPPVLAPYYPCRMARAGAGERRITLSGTCEISGKIDEVRKTGFVYYLICIDIRKYSTRKSTELTTMMAMLTLTSMFVVLAMTPPASKAMAEDSKRICEFDTDEVSFQI